MKQLLQYCERHLHETLEAIEALVALESPSTDKAAVDRCGTEVARRLRALGAEVELVAQRERGDHIRATLPGHGPALSERSESKGVMLLGHFDTVWPVGTLERMPLTRDGDRLRGPGTFDMKAGIALAMAAIAALDATKTPRPPITMVWTTDEEIGSATSRALVERAARDALAVLVLEPALPGGALKTARKGCGEFHLTVHGIAAHAGLDPGKAAGLFHIWVQPSVQIILTSSYMKFRQYLPEGPQRLRLYENWTFPRTTVDRPDFDQIVGPAYYEKYSQIVREDLGINPNVQQGMASGAYRPGRYSLDEYVVHRIANRVLDRVVGPDESASRALREGEREDAMHAT